MRALAVVAVLATSSSAGTPIVGGTADAGDPAVVLVAAYSSDHQTLYTCSGVVIAPTAVLTAAHCLDHPGYSFGVYFGADASAYVGSVDMLIQHMTAVASAHPHPAYQTTPPYTADIGIVLLAQATTVTPLPFAREAPGASMVGAAVRIVGYGETMYGTNNAARYAADTVIAALDGSETVLVGDAAHRTCIGDSGGPVIYQGTVLGVDSYSDTSGCTDPAHFRRTDSYATWIDPIAGTTPPAMQPDAGPQMVPDPTPQPDGGGCDIAGGTTTPLVALVVLALRRRRRA